MNDEQAREFKRRRKARATVTALILGGFVILIFALSIAKITAGWGR